MIYGHGYMHVILVSHLDIAYQPRIELTRNVTVPLAFNDKY